MKISSIQNQDGNAGYLSSPPLGQNGIQAKLSSLQMIVSFSPSPFRLSPQLQPPSELSWQSHQAENWCNRKRGLFSSSSSLFWVTTQLQKYLSQKNGRGDQKERMYVSNVQWCCSQIDPHKMVTSETYFCQTVSCHWLTTEYSSSTTPVFPPESRNHLNLFYKTTVL